MTYPELRAYLDKRLKNSALWHRLVARDKAKTLHTTNGLT